jgi:glutaredoxin
MKVRACALIALLLASCQGSPPPAEKPSVEPDAGGTVVYSYVDKSGRIRMAASLDDIPAEFRDRVVLTDTSRPRDQRLLTDRVLVVDLREEGEQGPVNYTVVDLQALSKRARGSMVRDPKDPGELGRWVVGRVAGRVRGLMGIEAPAPTAKVVLYTAPWCGFCRKAAAHLRSRGVAFEERDIDADRSAAVELSRKLRQAGLSGGGIPVLDIAGTIVIGFKKERIDRLLEKL